MVSSIHSPKPSTINLRSGFMIFIVFLFLDLHAQIMFSNYEKLGFGIGTALSTKPIDLHLRLGTNNRLVDTRIELAGFYHINESDYHIISLGLAIGLSPFGDFTQPSLVIPVELQVFPLKDFKRLAFAFEAGPEYLFDDDAVNLRHIWAIRYYFSDPD